MRLLLFLAARPGKVVSVRELLDEVWGDVVVTPDSVYQAVAALRRILGDDAKEPTYIATLPRRGYRLLATVGSWNESRPETPAVTARRSWRWLTTMLAVLALVALGYWVLQRVSPTAKSIAVLPFVDMSERQDQEYFADGMAEEVIDRLAKIPGIKIIGRTSSFQFKGKNEDLRKIGGALGAEYLVEGTVRKAGNRIRVTAQLVGAQNGSHLWSETYNEADDDVLNVQDRIAIGLVRALQVTVGADDLRAPAMLGNTEAYDLYLRGRYALDRWDRAGFESAAGFFQQALELDPQAVRAAEWLALAQSNLAVWGFVPPREGFERARLSAQRALLLNPRSGRAHSVLASTHAVFDWDWDGAERESQLALALEPGNAFVIGNVGFARSAFAQPQSSARLVSEAIALDPLFATWHEELGQMLYRAGRLADAEAELHKALALSSKYAEGYYYLGQILLAKGEFDAALDVMQKEVPENGRDAGLAIAYHALRRKSESDAALARLVKDRAEDAAYQVAQVYAYRAELDDAFTWLDRAYRQRDVELFWIKGDPLLKNLESDPRYAVLLQKMKLM